MTNTLHLLCAGAALGLVKAIQPTFEAQTGATLSARFGAVGAMKEALCAGEPCDLMIVTDAMIAELAASGELLGTTRATLGRVRTGIAVRSGEDKPDVGSDEALKAALLAATAIYFPDPVRATAGIHFADVMRQLGVHELLAPRFRTFPNGATAMREMAACDSPGLIGCTQVTEINYSPGIELVGALPQRFELVTAYTAAIGAKATEAALAQTLISMLAGEESLALREAGGFEVGDKA
jgi:molybdate transport system substrate-binding protein